MNHQELSRDLKELLTLRWSPVAVRLLKHGEEKPANVFEPSVPLRHCQAITAARRGNSIYMPLPNMPARRVGNHGADPDVAQAAFR